MDALERGSTPELRLLEAAFRLVSYRTARNSGCNLARRGRWPTADEEGRMSNSHDTFERGGKRVDDGNEPAGRPWLGVRFTCSGSYVRVFRNVAGTGYSATCPRCGRCVRFRVGSGGSDQRFFEVSC